MSRPRFAVYARGEGPARELRRLLARGLREAGFPARERDGRAGFARRADLHLLVAPHELLARGGERLRRAAWPEGVILYNTAQPDSAAFAFVRRLLPRARAVWDLDAGAARRWRAEGWRAAHLPPGWVEDPALYAPGRPWAKRPVGALFAGSPTPRRESFFRDADLGGLGARLLLSPAPWRPRAALRLARRAKVVLNVHRRAADYFEWHRAVVHGIGQGALVLSEPCGPSAPLRPGRDFATAPLADFPETLRGFLTTAAGRARAARMAARGLRTLKTRCRLAPALTRAVRSLGRPEGERARRARRLEEAARGLFAAAATPRGPRSRR
ncbi:MAG: hypothetical protein SF051_08425 [Elusimicrobiota bacterium]|nr:hypothetical protein [Elusimicrobiota bacterium]